MWVLMHPSVIKKKKAQVVSVMDANAQLMDPETYEVFDLPIPDDLKGKIESGSMVEVIEAMGRRAISRVLGSNE